MQRGNLVIYDNNGKVWYQSGEAEGDVLEHELPVGLPHKVIPFGTMAVSKISHVDIKNDEVVLIPIEAPKPTYEQLEAELAVKNMQIETLQESVLVKE